MTQVMLAIFGLPGGYEWLVVLVIAVLVFGPRFPKMVRSLGTVGKSIIEFRKVIGR